MSWNPFAEETTPKRSLNPFDEDDSKKNEAIKNKERKVNNINSNVEPKKNNHPVASPSAVQRTPPAVEDPEPSIEEAHVVSYETRLRPEKHTVYWIHWRNQEGALFRVSHRYSDFVTLQQQTQLMTPLLPRTLPWQDKFQASLLDQRTRLLDSFVQQLPACQSTCVAPFLTTGAECVTPMQPRFEVLLQRAQQAVQQWKEQSRQSSGSLQKASVESAVRSLVQFVQQDKSALPAEAQRRKDLCASLQQALNGNVNANSSGTSKIPVNAQWNAAPTSTLNARDMLMTSTRSIPSSASQPTSTPNTSHQLLQEQNRLMQQQDSQLNALSQLIDRQKHMGLAIGKELDLHNQMLTELDSQVEQTGLKLSQQTKKIRKL